MRLFEVATLADSKVDREAGSIRGVKVLGLNSRNRRRYLPEAVREAVGLYEGKTVNYNHSRDEKTERPIEDRAGWLEGVAVDADGGLSGDLHMLVADSRCEKIFEVAEKRPKLIALSHAAHGTYVPKDGIQVVSKIDRVDSVDLVTDAASVASLFESLEKEERSKMPKSVREIATSLKETAPLAGILCSLLEQEGMPAGAGDMPVETPEAGSSDSQIKAAFEQAIVAAFRDDKLDTKATLNKIKDILKAYDKLSGGDKPADASPAAEAAPTPESVRSDLAGLRDEFKKMESLIEGLRDRQVAKPKSTALRESAKDEGKPKDVKDFVRRLRGR